MNPAVNLVQLALAAGKTKTGSALFEAVSKGTAKLVVFSAACGANTRKKLQDKCAYRHVPVVELPEQDFAQISHKPHVAYAICDEGFARGILNKTRKER